jgi:hypothetical protein
MTISSGMLDDDTVVTAHRTKLKSVHVSSGANCSSTNLLIKIWDSRAETGGEPVPGGTQTKRKELLRVLANQNHSTAAFNYECDTHGVLANEGIYVEFVTGTGQCYVSYE